MDRGTGIDLAVEALFQAADEDSATGGPDLMRGIYPTVATITETGFDRVDEEEVAERFRVLLDRLTARQTETDNGGESR
jgi:proteasome beta subunit